MLSDYTHNTSPTIPQEFWTGAYPLEEDPSWCFAIGQDENTAQMRHILPADVLIKLFGLTLYMLCVGTDVPYQADPGSIRAVSADTLRQCDETRVASQQAPKLFVRMAKACLGWTRAVPGDDQEIAVEFLLMVTEGLLSLMENMKTTSI